MTSALYDYNASAGRDGASSVLFMAHDLIILKIIFFGLDRKHGDLQQHVRIVLNSKPGKLCTRCMCIYSEVFSVGP